MPSPEPGTLGASPATVEDPHSLPNQYRHSVLLKHLGLVCSRHEDVAGPGYFVASGFLLFIIVACENTYWLTSSTGIFFPEFFYHLTELTGP